jgi:2-C-methyl-D-erythritol 4-phosphate cytidylyltransferase / 2-C-methyl-D-erythritol 2,4-cyclodiphosphate synthase
MTGTVALVLAGGRGTRAGGGVPKQYRDIGGMPMLRHTLAAFAEHPDIDAVRAVIHPDDTGLYQNLTHGLDLLEPEIGSDSRQGSSYNGLLSLNKLNPSSVLIQDAARPFTDHATVCRIIDSLATSPAAIAAVPVIDTIKRGDAQDRVSGTVERAGLWRAQTPQGFRFKAILDAHEAVKDQELTDDAGVAEAMGMAVQLVMGHENNIKITTEEDFMRAETILRETNSGPAAVETRLGTGFDVHRFEPGDHVTICGVDIPHSARLKGHSDADVGLHAITDAIFGALAEGDIGDHFPPSDPQWKSVDSAIFLAKAAERVRVRQGVITSLDVTIICEMPKIGPHRDAMRTRIAEICDIDPGRVSVKATTTEGLGFTGRAEGIAAQAAAAIQL